MMRLSLALWLFVCVAIAQELPTPPPKPVPEPAPVPFVPPPAPVVDADVIQIERPTFPLQVAVPARVNFSGLTDEAFRHATLTVLPWDDNTPKDGAIVQPQWDWIVAKPYIAFFPVKPGRYVVTLTLHPENEWVRTRLVLLRGIADDRMEQSLLDEASAFATQFGAKLNAKYPHKKGSALVEVAGAVPPQPTPVPPGPNPPDPPSPTSGLVWTVVIRTVDTMTADQSQVLSDIRQWSDQQPSDKVAHWEFPPNAEGSDGSLDPRVASWVKLIPATAKQPYVFVASKGVSGKPVVLWQGELPPKADDVIAKIKEHLK